VGRGLRLLDDEDVVVDTHPHVRRLAVPLALVPVVVGVATYLALLVPAGAARGPLRAVVALAAVLLLARFTAVPLLRWRATRYVVTTHRLLLRTGVLRRRGRDIPLARVNDVTVERGVVDRLFGCGALVVESGGENGTVVLTEVPRVEDVAEELYRCVEDVTGRGDRWRETAR
jgi:uncharacterized membrane protein YdbT with pleckstrin-like domain